MTPLSTSEVIITFDITDASETARLNSIKQEGAAENICGGNTFQVCISDQRQHVTFIFIR